VNLALRERVRRLHDRRSQRRLAGPKLLQAFGKAYPRAFCIEIGSNDGYETFQTRRDFRPLLEAAGYRAVKTEPVIADPAVRELLPLSDSFFLFALTD